MRSLLVAVVLVTLFVARATGAAPLILSFDSLPTAQEWTYSGDGSAAADFSVDGTKLVLNTIGKTSQYGGYHGYVTKLITIDRNKGWEFAYRVQILQDQNTSSTPGSNNYGAFFSIKDGARSHYLGMSKTRLLGPGGDFALPVGQTPGAVHTYRFVYEPGQPVKYYMDQYLLGSHVGAVEAESARIHFGDATRGPSSKFELTSLTLVPEPSAMLTLLALAPLALRRR